MAMLYWKKLKLKRSSEFCNIIEAVNYESNDLTEKLKNDEKHSLYLIIISGILFLSTGFLGIIERIPSIFFFATIAGSLLCAYFGEKKRSILKKQSFHKLNQLKFNFLNSIRHDKSLLKDLALLVCNEETEKSFIKITDLVLQEDDCSDELYDEFIKILVNKQEEINKEEQKENRQQIFNQEKISFNKYIKEPEYMPSQEKKVREYLM